MLRFISLLFMWIFLFAKTENMIKKYCENTLLFLIKANEPKMRIFDYWMYNGESEAAYIRIWRLYDYVDYFVIIIAELTFSGQHHNITFHPFEKEIEPYKDKILIFKFPKKICYRHEYRKYDSIWCREKSQRDYGLIMLQEQFNLTTNDIFLVSDCDEIFTREALRYIIKNPPQTLYYVRGVMYFPYYFHVVEEWNWAFVYRYDPNNHHLSKMRKSSRNPIYSKNYFVTHCTYCFSDIEQYRNKIKSFSHQEYNKEPYITNDWIFKSHYCRMKIKSGPGYDESNTNWTELIPNDPRLTFLVDPSFEYPLNLTSYKKEDLENLCDRKYRRTPFDKLN